MSSGRSIYIPAHQTKADGRHSYNEAACMRAEIPLRYGRVSDVFRVVGGPCLVRCMFMEVTEAIGATACNMSWVLDSDMGGKKVIGDALSVASIPKGDLIWAELDGTALVQATTGTGLIHRGYGRKDANGEGTILPVGGVDIVLSALEATGKGTLYVWYKPLTWNACMFAEEMHTSTTSSSTTSSTTSSTSSTASTASTSSSTSSSTSTSTSTSTSSSTSSSTSTSTSTSSSSSSSSSSTTTTAAGP